MKTEYLILSLILFYIAPSYGINTSGVTIDTKITGFEAAQTTRTDFYNDENGLYCGGTQASINFTPTINDYYRVTALQFSSPSDSLTCIVASSSNETCNDSDDGTIVVSAIGGTSPYIYSNGITTNTDGSFTGLAADTFSIMITDSIGSTTTCANVIILQPDPLTCTFGSSSNETCNDSDDGTISVNAGGGTSPYVYDNGSTMNTDGSFTSLGAGTYSITITDLNGCTTTCVDVVIAQPDLLTCTYNSGSTQICNGSNDGTIIVSAGGGTSPYIYDNGSTTNTDGSFSSLAAGTYSITISDAIGCTTTCADIVINADQNPTTAAAGPDQTICSTTDTLTGNTPAVGSGMWSIIGGSGTIVNPSNTFTSITGLGVGNNTFRWTISNGVCPPSTDDVVITRDTNPTTANAGLDQTESFPKNWTIQN